ncbi:TIGR04197 family type VII secretion effector [Bombilactobacillus thymidiniphilus]|uniref:TIGR04197 family type VII secretion effector n=1 Tax=Bombilactobacillus thymidiniphilus TaxID=2923363 RepID=A0ABY4PEX5_9LACO|nr:TIGR04197 family type VII secretion effector [Bombilactobacillus thymidiniphilus]UQS84305.1 TIGR04197 family type VII secretion effector [Bombilactobacillus thymidiniphilus]
MTKIKLDKRALDNNAGKAKSAVSALGKGKLTSSKLDTTNLDPFNDFFKVAADVKKTIQNYEKLASHDVEQYKKAGAELQKADDNEAKQMGAVTVGKG